MHLVVRLVHGANRLRGFLDDSPYIIRGGIEQSDVISITLGKLRHQPDGLLSVELFALYRGLRRIFGDKLLEHPSMIGESDALARVPACRRLGKICFGLGQLGTKPSEAVER